LFAKKSGSWAVYYNFDQYLYEPVKGSGQGFGIFGRFSAADGNPNFMQYFYSFGVSGKGLMPMRPEDSYGLGWYYININNPELTTPIGPRKFLRDEQGGEAYYSIALTPWAYLTPHIQVIRGAQKRTVGSLPANRAEIDTATIMGLRLHLLF
jgi:porin